MPQNLFFVVSKSCFLPESLFPPNLWVCGLVSLGLRLYVENFKQLLEKFCFLSSSTWKLHFPSCENFLLHPYFVYISLEYQFNIHTIVEYFLTSNNEQQCVIVSTTADYNWCFVSWKPSWQTFFTGADYFFACWYFPKDLLTAYYLLLLLIYYFVSNQTCW